jgi:hypothetical protein
MGLSCLALVTGLHRNVLGRSSVAPVVGVIGTARAVVWMRFSCSCEIFKARGVSAGMLP